MGQRIAESARKCMLCAGGNAQVTHGLPDERTHRGTLSQCTWILRENPAGTHGVPHSGRYMETLDGTRKKTEGNARGMHGERIWNPRGNTRKNAKDPHTGNMRGGGPRTMKRKENARYRTENEMGERRTKIAKKPQ